MEPQGLEPSAFSMRSRFDTATHHERHIGKFANDVYDFVSITSPDCHCVTNRRHFDSSFILLVRHSFIKRAAPLFFRSVSTPGLRVGVWLWRVK